MSEEIEKLIQLRLSIERLQQQILRLQSNAESEKGTLQRQGDVLRKEISLLESKYNEILFKPDTGLLIKLDRLEQDSHRRKKMQYEIRALWAALLTVIVGIVLDRILRK